MRKRRKISLKFPTLLNSVSALQGLVPEMEYSFQFLKLRHLEIQRLLFLLGLVVAVTYLSFQSLLLPYGNALRSLLPQTELQTQINGSILSAHSFAKSVMVRNPLTVNSSVLIEHDTEPKGKEVYKEIDLVLEGKGIDDTFENSIDRNVDGNFPSEVSVAVNESLALVSFENQGNGSIQDKANEISSEKFLQEKSALTVNIPNGVNTAFSSNGTSLNYLVLNGSVSVGSASPVAPKNGTSIMTSPGKKKKKMKCEMPPKSITSISEMNHILVRKHASGHSLRPRWSSVRDQEILAVKSQIEHPPIATNDPELYAPLFRNVSMFKRSYELMESTLKVYIYKDGNKPIFHQPILKGLYASEGWFMKLMEGHKQFSVKDSRKAHLFYMPFSSRMLEYALYVRNSHNRTNLRQFLKEYSETIAAKYPYWNRTNGADHFLVACHDWAPYETRHHMERCIKALCNADVTTGFKIGRDVSLAETYVRSARNPLRDLGGKPPSQRDILAFYAGNMHGYLRPILLKSWKDKDPDMKIFGPMPPGVASKMNYIQHMKSSKYCICPKGYEVNSPRVVEAIFYECIPVIISDNFVPPFFEVLNWESFSVILAEKDIPNLKEVLLSIPEDKYLQMQLAVRRVQKHFLWHAKPLKYDLFHMTLHSIWYNRVFQIKLR